MDAASTAVTVQRPDGGWAVLDRTDGSPIIESSPSETTVLVHRTRADGPVSSSDAGGYRYTFSLAPLAGDDVAVVEAEVVRLPIEFGAGAEYRLLRNSIGDRFTFDCTCPSGGT